MNSIASQDPNEFPRRAVVANSGIPWFIHNCAIQFTNNLVSFPIEPPPVPVGVGVGGMAGGGGGGGPPVLGLISTAAREANSQNDGVVYCYCTENGNPVQAFYARANGFHATPQGQYYYTCRRHLCGFYRHHTSLEPPSRVFHQPTISRERIVYWESPGSQLRKQPTLGVCRLWSRASMNMLIRSWPPRNRNDS